MKLKNKNHFFKDSCNFIIDTIKEYKIRTIIISTILVITLLTGIIVAIRTSGSYDIQNGYGVVDLSANDISTATFFTRLLSMLFVFIILLACSYNRYTFIIGLIFLGYRAYLLGLNLCLMIIFYGFSGVVVSVVIAFPCQLITLAILGVFFILMSKTFCDYRKFGGCKVPRQKTKLILTTLVLLLLVCIFESILLTLFSAKVILVI